MKNIIKKNQIVLFVIGIMIIAAGYLSFTNETNNALEAGALADSEEIASIGDARLVSANVADSNTIGNNVATNKIDGVGNNTINDVENMNNVVNNINGENSNTNDEAEENFGNNEYANNLETSQTVETSNTQSDEYFTNSRLERNTLYSQQIENYQDILNNTNVSEAQKQIAQEEITRITKHH